MMEERVLLAPHRAPNLVMYFEILECSKAQVDMKGYARMQAQI